MKKYFKQNPVSRLTFYFIGLTLMGSFTFLLVQPLAAKDKANVPVQRSTIELKKYMKNFAGFISDLEIMRTKEKKTDWKLIQDSLNKMSKTLHEMQTADTQKKYQQFTSLLEERVNEMQDYTNKKDKTEFYDSFDKMTNTCFSCHAVHRPSDYLMPTENHPKISKK